MKSGHGKILLIDDDRINVEIMTIHLENEGYALDSFLSATESFNMLRTYTTDYDLILLDLMMPEMGGMAFLKELKKDPKLNMIKVVMQTGYAERDDIFAGMEAGIHCYLSKPYTKQMLLGVVNRLLKCNTSMEI